MSNLFGGRDLFGNNIRVPNDFQPEWQSPESGVVDVSGNVVGQTKLNPYDYATQNTAQQLSTSMGMPLQTAMASGPGASANPQYELATNTPGHALNAGRVAQQMAYSTKGRFNQDTGQYDKEDPAVIMARLKADIAPPMLDSQKIPGNTISPSKAYDYPNYVGAHPMNVGGYNPAGARGQSPVRTTMQSPSQPSGAGARPTQPPTGAGTNTAGGDARARMAAALRARLRSGGGVGGGGQQRPAASPYRPV